MQQDKKETKVISNAPKALFKIGMKDFKVGIPSDLVKALSGGMIEPPGPTVDIKFTGTIDILTHSVIVDNLVEAVPIMVDSLLCGNYAVRSLLKKFDEDPNCPQRKVMSPLEDILDDDVEPETPEEEEETM